MSKLGTVLQEFLDLNEWNDEIEDDEASGKARLNTRLTVAGQSCRLYIDAFDDGQTAPSLSLFIYTPFRVNLENYSEACMVVNAINYQSRFVRFEINPSGGDLRAVASTDLRGAQVSGQHVDAMLDAAVWCTDHWMPTLAAVAISGRSAADVLKEHDESEEETDKPEGNAAP